MEKTARGRKARASSDELLLAGVKAIVAQGIDHVNVSDIAKLSQVSRPTFYTYFGDMSGFYAEIWLRFGRDWLEAQGSIDSQIDPEIDQALLEIFAISRRVPELQEVVQPDFEQWWQAKVGDDQLEGIKLVWKLGFLLGYKLSSKVSAKASLGLPVLGLLDYPENVLSLPGFEGLGKLDPKLYPPMRGIVREGDTVEDILTQAAIEVIATSGVAATSMTRIARRARVSTGSVYPRFKNSDAIIQHSFTSAIAGIVSKNVEVVAEQGIGADQYALTVNAGYGEARKYWRHFRVEMHIEAIHNRALAKFMEGGFEKATSFLENSFLEFGSTKEQAQVMAWFLHSHAMGISLIYNQLPQIAEHDNRIMGRWIVSQLIK